MDLSALLKVSYGLYLISSRSGERFNSYLTSSVFQVNSNPPMIVTCANKNNLTTQYMEESGILSISVLHQGITESFIDTFGFKSGRDINKFENIHYKLGKTGAPIILDNSVAYLEGKIDSVADLGLYKLFVIQVIDAEVLDLSSHPLTYKHYLEVLNGKTPSHAPLFQHVGSDALWACELCSYEYDPQKGDPEHNIPPQTSFEKLPESWLCPLCGVPKSQFKRK